VNGDRKYNHQTFEGYMMRLHEKCEKWSNEGKGQRMEENLLGNKQLSCNCQKIMMT
jgi:hypothetical protein